jgi:O-antigen/teichoic acid export membrane protein
MPISLRAIRAISSPTQMVLGLGLFGFAGYVFVALTGHTLSGAEANLAITFYFLTNVIGPGIFYALEQVTSRATSSAVAGGRPLRPTVDRIRRAGICLVAAVVAILLLLSPITIGATLHGNKGVAALVLATPVIAAGLHLVRGLLGGTRRFGGYAATLSVEGLVRLLLTVVLALAGTTQAWVYGVGYLAASVVAMLAGLMYLRGTPMRPAAEPDPRGGTTERYAIGGSLATLAGASLLAQLLPNIAPLAITSRLAQDSAVALAFGQAAVIARIPLLLFFPVQTVLLPTLTAAVTRGQFTSVVRWIKLTLAGVTGVGAVCSVLFVLFGHWVLRTFLNTSVELDRWVMLLLAVSTVVLIASYAAQSALVALRRDHIVTAGWLIGSAVTLGLALLPSIDPVTTAAAAQVLGPVLTLLLGLFGIRAALRQPGHRPQPVHVVR